MIDLVLQQVGGLVEQVDRNQPIGQPPDHLVAAIADRSSIRGNRRTAPARRPPAWRRPLPARNSESNVAAASSWIWRVIAESGCAAIALRIT